MALLLGAAFPPAYALLPPGLADEAGEVVLKTLTVQGAKGSVDLIDYLQYLPARVIVSEMPIVVLIHGSASNALNAAKEYGCDGIDQGKFKTAKVWKDWADKHQVMLLCPVFDQRNFGSDKGPLGGYRGRLGRHRPGLDDRLSDADMVVNQIVDRYLDAYPEFFQDQILMAGHSAGGMFTSRYVVTHVDRFKAAVISSAGTFPWPDSRPWTDGMGKLHVPNLTWENPTSSPRDYFWKPIWYKFADAAEKPILMSFGRCEVKTDLPDDCSCRWKRFFSFVPAANKSNIVFHGPSGGPITLTKAGNNSGTNFVTIWDLKNDINAYVPGVEAKVAGNETLIEMDVDFSYCGTDCYQWYLEGTGDYFLLDVDFADNDMPGNTGDGCKRFDGELDPLDPAYGEFNGILGDGERYVEAMRENAGLSPTDPGIRLNVVEIDDHYPSRGTSEHTAFLQDYLGCRGFTDSLDNHVAMGRAYKAYVYPYFSYYTQGGGDYLGKSGSASAEIWESSPGHFRSFETCVTRMLGGQG